MNNKMKTRIDKAMENRSVSFKEYISVALSSLNSYMLVAFVSSFLSYYYTHTLIVDLKFITILMLVARVWDAVNDPLMGLIVDKSRNPKGQMVPYIKRYALPMAMSTMLLFLPIGGPQWLKMVYASITYIAFGMLYTATDIPFWGALSVITPDEGERASVLSASATIGSVGGILPMVIMPVAKTIFGEKWSYFAFALFCAVFCWYSLFRSGKYLKERVKPPKKVKTFKENFSIIAKNRPLLMTLLGSVLACTRYLMMLSALYIATYVIKFPGLDPTVTVLILYVVVGVGMVIGMFTTPALYKKFGYKAVFIAAGIVGAISLGAAYFIDYTNIPVVFTLMLIGGIPLGVYNVITYPMVGDSLDYLEYKTGHRAEAFCFSLQSFVSKFNQAFASVAILVALLIVGFKEPVEAGEILEQTDHTLKGMYSLVSILPALGFLLSIIPMIFYDFHGEKRKMITAELKKRRAEALENGDDDANDECSEEDMLAASDDKNN